MKESVDLIDKLEDSAASNERLIAAIERLIAVIQADIESRESRTVEIEVDSFGAGYAPDTN